MSIQEYYYDSAYNNYIRAWTTFWSAQTFTPSANYDIKAVMLLMKKSGVPGTITVSIRGTSVNVPVTPDLVSATVDGTTIGTSYGWVKFVFATPYSLVSGTKYAIIISNSTGSSSANYVDSATDSISPSYTNGGKYTNSASGINGSWTAGATQDFIFITSDTEEILPVAVTTPTPIDAGIVTKLTNNLSWAASFLATSYDVYFGEAGSIELVSSAQTGLSYSMIGLLKAGLIYEWRIDSTNDEGTTEGTTWTFTTQASSGTVRLMPFIYSSSIAYTVELGNLYMRFDYADSEVDWIASPYLTADLFKLHYSQIADVTRIVNTSYAPRKLSRVSATEFTLEQIPFRKGPFLMRNDLIDPDVLSAATMSFSEGKLSCNGQLFEDGHVGALFKLILPRVNTISTGSFSGGSVPFVICNPIELKGSFRFRTHGTWSAKIIFQRRENSTDDNAWDDVQTMKGKDDQNLDQGKVENEYNVEFRAIIAEYTAGTISADIISENPTQEGIVKVVSLNSDQEALVEPIVPVPSSKETKRWQEGAWSDATIYPASLAFIEGRCVYAGPRMVRNPIIMLTETPE